MTATMTKYEVTREGLSNFNAKNADWLKKDRIEGMDLFEKLPFPVRTEESWRRTNPKDLMLDGKQVITGESQFGTLGEGSAPAGITFGALESLITPTALAAGNRHHDNGLNTFTALNQAFWQGGTLLEVGDNVSFGTLALHAQHHYEGGADTLALPRSIVSVGKFSKVTVVETYTSTSDELMAAPVLDITVSEGANVKYVIVQKWGSETKSVPTVRAHIEKDAHLLVLYVGLGGQLTKLFGECDLEGEGCKSEVMGLVMAAEKQHFDFDVNQYHRVGANVSDVLFHVALADEARSIFSGNIICGPGSQKIDGYQQNRNLLLSSKARATSMPKLEIEANDVRCTHGATFTTFDEAQNFYLRSRGLSEAEAQRLLVRGFFQEVVNRVGQEVVVEHLMELVTQKMDQTLGA